MKNLKQMAALAVLTSTLTVPVGVMAEPALPPGTTVNNVPLTTVQTQMSNSMSSNQMMDNRNSMNMDDDSMQNDMDTPMTDATDDGTPSINNNAGTLPTP